jgi:tetratricopeptide (TPR) repeat protein
MGESFSKFVVGFPAVFFLAVIAYMAETQALMKHWGFGFAYIADGHDEQAEDIFEEIVKFDEKVGTKYLGAAARCYLGFITIRKGELRKGINMVEEMIGFWLSRENQPRLAITKHLLGRVYLLMLQGSGSKSLSFIAKNIYFLVRTLPLAARKAEEYLAEAIRISKMIGAKVILAQALMDFGCLCKIQGRRDEAIRCLSESVELFEKCEASVYLKKARDVLSSI